MVSADIGKGLAEAAAANVALNGFAADRHSFVTGECFALLEQYVAAGRRFEALRLEQRERAPTRA